MWLFVVLLFTKLAAKTGYGGNHKSLLIIKVDAIGDYIIFRNFIETIRKSKKYQGYKITLLGNSLWKDIATSLDQNYIDEFIWFDANTYTKYKHRKDFLLKLASKRFSDAIMCHYSRTVFTEILAFTATAKKLKGITNDYLHLSHRFRLISDRFYTSLYFITEEHKHEFLKLRSFIGQIIETDIDTLPKKPSIQLANSSASLTRFGITQPFILINCGAGDVKRQLPLDKMKDVIKTLLEAEKPIYFTGTRSDTFYADSLIDNFPQKKEYLKNIAGQTTLLELLHLINIAQFVVCNESSTYHMAIAMNKEVFCFSGGGHFERFANYPTIKTHLLFNNMPCFNCNWNCIYTLVNGKAYPCIEAIEMDRFKAMLAGSLLLKN